MVRRTTISEAMMVCPCEHCPRALTREPIDSAVAAFLRHLRAMGRSPATIETYGRDLAHLVRHIPAIGTAAMTSDMIDDVLVALGSDEERARGQVTMNRIRSGYRSFLTWCHRSGRTTIDLGTSIRYARVTSAPTRPASDVDVEQLVAYLVRAGDRLALRDRLLVRLLAETGLRRSELLRLKVGDCDFAEGIVRVELAKGEGRQVKAVSPSVCSDALAYLSKMQAPWPAAPLFPGAGGVSALTPRGLHAMLVRRSTEAGLGAIITPHSMRTSFASRLYADSHDLLRVSHALGHRRISSTTRYVFLGENASKNYEFQDGRCRF